MKQIAGIVKTDTQNRKAIYKVLKMDKVPDGTNVLLAFLGHPRFIKMFKEDHPSSKITVLENKDLSWLFSDSPYDVKLVDPVNINLIKETLKDMKFDYIIMNPPYNGNLHLKILEEAMKHSDNVVNLSPVRWLQDPLADLNKRSDWNKFQNILKHIESVDTITSDEACRLFDAGFNMQLGVYKITPKGGYDYSIKDCPLRKVISKISENISNNTMVSEPQKFSVVITLISGGKNGWTEKTSHWMLPIEKAFYINGKNSRGETYYQYRERVCWGNIKPKAEVTHLEFDTEKESKNFYNACETTFMRYLFKTTLVDVHVHTKYFPWMGNEINPRTGLKGYEGEWLDEDFYKFFNLTADEIKIIEDTMEKYK